LQTICVKKEEKMKIITWNINGYRSIVGQNPSKKYDVISKDNKLFQYINDENPDIIMLQETKSELEQINKELRYPDGYLGFYHSARSRKGYSGVVTFTKKQPNQVITNLGIERFDCEGRILELVYDDFNIFNVYFPNGTSRPERVDYKLEFYDALFTYTNKLKNEGKNIIISGDYNTAHNEIDLARPKENENNSGFLRIERDKMDWIIQNEYFDSFRELNNEGDHYTWWSNRGRAKENNVGWRIDYHMVTEEILKNISKVYIQPDTEGSDHCPVVLELK
jgi:exodeoxyribonuclease-3